MCNYNNCDSIQCMNILKRLEDNKNIFYRINKEKKI